MEVSAANVSEPAPLTPPDTPAQPTATAVGPPRGGLLEMHGSSNNLLQVAMKGGEETTSMGPSSINSSPSMGPCKTLMLTEPEELQLPPTMRPSATRPVIREEFNVAMQETRPAVPVDEVHPIAEKNLHRCHIYDSTMYNEMYERSITDSNFWGDMAMTTLRWMQPFTKVRQSDLKRGQISWFMNGKLNVCDNCVDRWAEQTPRRTALIWEADEPGKGKEISYEQLKIEVCRFANMLTFLGVRKYDTVTIYMPMSPEVVFAMLACARIGAIHSIVFAGYSAPNLRDRMRDARSTILITADQGIRGGKSIPLKAIADQALASCRLVKTCVVFRRGGEPINWMEGRDVNGHELLKGMRPYCPSESMDSEDLLFMLHTSGSTGKAKGIAHSSAGYLLYAALTHKFVFDYHPGDVYGCVADVGWITGHTYVVYGPLCNGATTVLFESVPTYPDAGRYWSMIEKYKINSFYTAPTALKLLMRFGDEIPKKYDLSSLRILGSVGEPIGPEAWKWYNEVIGNKKCNIVDTYWQTESGGHLLTSFPGATRTKPGCATVPFFGIEPAILDPITGEEKKGNDVQGVLVFKRDWPGMMRTIFGDHGRIFASYLSPYPGYYFSGDGAYRDKDGYYWVTGRVDDTINVSGHRLGAVEVESALMSHNAVSMAAVVPKPHPIKGNGLFCLVIPKKTVPIPENFEAELIRAVRQRIGPVATPDVVRITDQLPTTASGKILRSVLRKIVHEAFEQETEDVEAAVAQVMRSIKDIPKP